MERYVRLKIDPDAGEWSPDDPDVNDALPEGVEIETLDDGLGDMLDYAVQQIPNIEDALSAVARYDDEIVRVPVHDLIDMASFAKEDPMTVLMALTKAKQGVTALAHDMQQQFDDAEDDFRVWKANVLKQLNRTGDDNPLAQRGLKTTNKAQRAFLRDLPEYKKHKRRINRFKVYKGKMWSTKNVIDLMIKIVSAYLQDPDDMSEVAQKVSNQQDLSDLAKSIAEDL